MTVTVAVPVRDGGPLLGEVLAAVRAQQIDEAVELLVADSQSRDGSAELARSFGAEVFTVEDFSHGGTRNELMRRARGDRVVFLTQDATPGDDRWLARLLGGFTLADDVALVHGPYVARPQHEFTVGRELEDWFATMPPGVTRGAVPGRVPGPEAFFTDANGAVARWAWERLGFRPVRYAEDRLLGLDVLDAGLAKAYVPAAAVIHSHAYAPPDLLRRCFDEWRGLREVTGHVESPRAMLRAGVEGVRADRAWLRAHGRRLAPGTARSLRHHAIRAAGAVAGSHADRLPPALRGSLSLEGRATWEPVP